MNNIQYRPEIDGLRAISVIGVLLYHAHLGFPGGYIGVDVFFVISGFLITGIIARGLDNGSFSLAEFWVRRIKRILPAVSVLTATVLLAGFMILAPDSLKELADSALAQSTLWANFYFLNASGGYFASKTEMMPLLHTWSLAVEEQFYLFLPLLLAVLFKYARKRAVAVLSCIAIFSFVLSIIITRTDQSQSFYLLHTRTWELLAGSLLALSAHRVSLKRPAAELLSAFGLILIFIPMFALDTRSAFPGLNALAPVAGAVAFIAGTQQHQTLARRLTASRPMVFVGLISYSLYLWHWPLFAFARHLYVDPDLPAIKLTLLAGSIVLAVLSWRFIETPFRNRKLLSTRSATLRFGVAITAALCIVSGTISLGKGFPQRLSKYTAILQDMDSHGEEYKSKGAGVVIGDPLRARPDFILWGDSHAMMVARTMDRMAAGQGLQGIAYINTARIPVTNLDRPLYRKDVINYNRKVFEQILSSGIKQLILTSRWSENLNDESGIRLVSDRTDGKAETSLPDAAASLGRQLKSMLAVCRASGIRVYILQQTPENTDEQTARHFYIRQRYPSLNPGTPDRFTISLKEHREQQAAFERILDTLEEDEFLRILDPAPAFFNNEQKRLETYGEGHSHYRDDNHLTEYGVRRFMTPVLAPLLQEIWQRAEIQAAHQ